MILFHVTTFYSTLHIYIYICISFKAAPMAYGNSQATGWIVATAANQPHGHSKAGPEPHLWPTSQLIATPGPQPTEWGQGSNPHPHGCSWIHFHCALTGTLRFIIFYRQLKFIHFHCCVAFLYISNSSIPCPTGFELYAVFFCDEQGCHGILECGFRCTFARIM